MGYDSLTSDTETLTKVKLNQVDRLKKQLQAAMKTIGNLDERLTSLESLVQAALFKQQDDIKALVVEVNSLKGLLEEKEAAKKFDMDAMPAQYGGAGAPPVG
jgi:predicted translin family RNA/ssDNA-binding protein